MKKREWSKFLITIGFVVNLLYLLIAAISEDSIGSIISSAGGTIVSLFLIDVLIVGFIWSSNKTVERVGFCLAAVSAVSGLISIIMMEFDFAAIMTIAYVALYLCGVVMFAVKCTLNYFDYKKIGDNSQLDLLHKYIDLENKGVISKEELDMVKQDLLKAEVPNKETNKFSTLKKWKKAFDEGAITKEEFDQIKKQLL